MIKYQLQCGNGHEFEGWFQSSTAYEREAEQRRLACPNCGSPDVSKAIMAPRVSTGESSPCLAELRSQMRALRAEVENRGEYVGPRFAEEARRIHLEETEHRTVWGEASPSEVKSLIEDGVPVLPLPPKEN